ncbi:hypothetical protein AAG906_036783 [Vitis piasezkii]
MASSSSIILILCGFTLFSLLLLANSSPDKNPATITLPLTPLFTKNPSSDPWQLLSHLTSASLTRAHHLKHRKNTSSVNTPLFAHSYGGYSVSLSFGTPSQTLSFVMDTGSSLVWFPCTSRYVCTRCSFPNIDPAKIPTFIPKLSSSAKIVGCLNPKCGFVMDSEVRTRCPGCDQNSANCTKACPTYAIQYGLGTTVGLLLLESLVFAERTEPDFVVGCSILSSRQPSGIAGFGRGPSSLPKQMGLKKFSYCLLSHRFDDSPKSSKMTLYVGPDSKDDKTGGLSYTPFRKNPVSSNSAFKEYYYVTLRHIIVGDKRVKIPYSFMVAGSDGNGGTIVDSGSTFTFMEKPVFEAVATEFDRQMANYTRAADVEARSGLKPCFNLSGVGSVALPSLVFQFKGGAKMELPVANYFSLVGDLSVLCLTIVSNEAVGSTLSSGPSIILGNYQSQNFYTEYDLENQRFGFRRQRCK